VLQIGLRVYMPRSWMKYEGLTSVKELHHQCSLGNASSLSGRVMIRHTCRPHQAAPRLLGTLTRLPAAQAHRSHVLEQVGQLS
jgi:hypothetical protein